MAQGTDTLGRRTRAPHSMYRTQRAVLGERGVLGDDARTAVAYAWCALRDNGQGCNAYHIAPYRARVRESYVPRDRHARWPLRVADGEGTRAVVVITVRAARARFDTYRAGKRDAWAEQERARIARRVLDPNDAPQHVAHTCPTVKRDATRHDAPRYGAPAAHAGTCTREHTNDAQRAACDRIRDAARRHRMTVYRDTVTRIALREGICVHA